MTFTQVCSFFHTTALRRPSSPGISHLTPPPCGFHLSLPSYLDRNHLQSVSWGDGRRITTHLAQQKHDDTSLHTFLISPPKFLCPILASPFSSSPSRTILSPAHPDSLSSLQAPGECPRPCTLRSPPEVSLLERVFFQCPAPPILWLCTLFLLRTLLVPPVHFWPSGLKCPSVELLLIFQSSTDVRPLGRFPDPLPCRSSPAVTGLSVSHRGTRSVASSVPSLSYP